MLPSPSYRLVLIILFGSFLFTWSCRREVEIPLPGIKIDGKPSAASLSGTATGPVGTNKMEFRVDLYVVDRNGNFVTGLKPGNLGIAATSPSSFTYALSKLEVLGGNAKAGGYSALLLLDQSGSIVSTDPLNLRIQAGKVFLDYMGGADQVALGSFTESSYYPNSVILHHGFSRNRDAMKRTLDSLAGTVFGGTPLYYSSIVATEYTARNAKTSNKAVVVFTDGQNTSGSGSLQSAITSAQTQKIPLFMVGLSSGVNTQVLSQMANETGGAFFFAKDAEQLVTTFGTLGNLLRGSAQLYRSAWVATRRTGNWTSGSVIAETIKIILPNNEVIETPFYVKVP